MTETSQRHHQNNTETSRRQDKDKNETRPRHDRDITETSPRQHQNNTETSSKKDRDKTETRPRHHRDITETSPKQHRDITETRPRQHQNNTETSPKNDRDKTETRQRHDRDITETRPRHPEWFFCGACAAPGRLIHVRPQAYRYWGKNDNLKMYLLWKRCFSRQSNFFPEGTIYGCPFPHFSCFFEAMPSHKVLEKRTPEMRDWRPKCNDSESQTKNWNPDDLAGQNHGNLRGPPQSHTPQEIRT